MRAPVPTRPTRRRSGAHPARPVTRSRRAAAKRPARRPIQEERVETAHFDTGVLAASSLLLFTGVVMSYSSTAPLALENALPPLFLRHLGALGLGVIAATVTATLPLSTWRRVALPLWLVGLALLVATGAFGVEVNGAQRWLEVPGTDLRFQPVELAKCFTLLAAVSVVVSQDSRRELGRRRIWTALALAIAPVALLLRQPDFGNAVLLLALVALVLVVAGAPLRRLASFAVFACACAAAYIATNAYALRRVVAFLDPWRESRGSGFQLVQSYVAFSQGGLFGVGLGDGRQKLFYLPKAHTDFILSLVAEELGLLGVLVVLGGFAALCVAGMRVARRARDRFALLLAFAMTALLTLPAIINSAVVMGLLPTKGLTLPFLSYGGTSLVTCCAALGLLLAVSRHAAPPAEHRLTRDGSRGIVWR